MAKYSIVSLNYMTSGNKGCILNMDTLLDYEISNYVYFLDHENSLSCIRTEQGSYDYIYTDYIETEHVKDTPVSEECSEKLNILNEEQHLIEEYDNKDGKFILLKTATDAEEYQTRLKKFNRDRLERNRTFLIPLLKNNDDGQQSQKNVYSDKVFSTNPMYEMKDVCVKLNNKKQVVNQIRGTDVYFDVYAPQMNDSPIEFCQCGQDSFLLMDSTSRSNYRLKTNLEDNDKFNFRSNYKTQYSVGSLDMYTYKPVNSLSLEISADVFDEDGNFLFVSTDVMYFRTYGDYLNAVGSDHMQELMTPFNNLVGIESNYLMNVNQSTENMMYDKGDIYANTILIGKTAYDSLYDMNVLSNMSVSKTRKFCGLGNTNDNVYAKYYDAVEYRPYNSMYNVKTGVNDIYVEKHGEEQYPYQKLEFVSPMQFSKKSKHKSNMFSIRIRNTNIENIEYDQQEGESEQQIEMRRKIQSDMMKDIRNISREIVNNVCPANTQLFNVYFGE